MIEPKNIWTYLLVTVVTVLIWAWAAGETRKEKPLDVRLQFAPPDPANWLVKPAETSTRVVFEGSQLALHNAQNVLRTPTQIEVPATARQTVDLVEHLKQIDEIRATGVTVKSAEPAYIELELDPIERFTAKIKAILPGIKTEGEVTIEPAEVLVAMPGQMKQRVGRDFAIEAIIDRTELDRIPPGVAQTQEVALRLPEGFGSSENVLISPPRARLMFTIKSRTRETRLDTVRVQLAGPPEDRDAYIVDIDPKQLLNVTITADAELIRRIEANEVPVIALLQVGSREKEGRIESKRITAFLALVPEPGGSRGVLVTGKINDSAEMPLVKLKITVRGVN